MVNDLIDQRLRQMQTAYPAEVIAYDSSTSLATIKPLFIEAWRGPNDERIEETIENAEDAYVENVLVMHPRTAAFRVALPVAPGDTGLALVTKFSLDRFREGAGAADPGDLRKFTMSGSVFFPTNLYVDTDNLDASDDDTVITISAGGTAYELFRASSLQTAIEALIDDIKGASGAITADNIVHTLAAVAYDNAKSTFTTAANSAKTTTLKAE